MTLESIIAGIVTNLVTQHAAARFGPRPPGIPTLPRYPGVIVPRARARMLAPWMTR